MLIPIPIPTPLTGPAIPTEQAAESRAKPLTFVNVKRTLNRNLSSLRRDSLEETSQALVTAVDDLQRATEDIYSRTMEPSYLSPDGLPGHGSKCPAFSGQYLHLTSFGEEFSAESLVLEPVILKVNHGLQRTPVGALTVYHEGGEVVPLLLGLSSRNIPKANSRTVYFRHYGERGVLAVCVLF